MRDKNADVLWVGNSWGSSLARINTKIRHISLLERDGKLQVIVPVYRSSQMGVMTVRSQAEVAALKARAR